MNGKYDELYERRAKLWPSKPGRIITELLASNPPLEAILDIGCGDGKNAIPFAKLGARVHCIDVSRIALKGFQERLADQPVSVTKNISIALADACVENLGQSKYDCVVLYGVAHCIDDVCLLPLVHKIHACLRHGGWLCFSSFNSDLPVPNNHSTGQLFLRGHNEILQTLKEFDIITARRGVITEKHPGVATHSHAISWILAKKT